MTAQLGLPLLPRVHADPWALSRSRVLGRRLGPPVESPDGSIRCSWRGAGKAWWRAEAWSVEPVPSGCPAYERGWRWFYSAQARDGEANVRGGMPGSRDRAIDHAQRLVLRLELGAVRRDLVRRSLALPEAA